MSGRNALTWGMFEPDPRNVLNASEPTQADAYSYNAPVVRDAWAAAQDPQTWQDAAQQYGQGLLAGSVAPGAKGMALDPAALQVLREMTPGFRAYHGSPHSFDAFDSAKIGTGEGAQAYGHGLYVADSEGVARSYRDALGDHPTVGGVPYNASDPAHRAAFYIDRNGGDKAATSDYIKNEIGGLQDEIARDPTHRATPYRQEALGRLAEMQAHLDSGAETPAFKAPGHMYEVQVNADPAHFLDWDKPRDQLAPNVQAFAKEHTPQAWENAADGSSLYHGMAKEFGSHAAASAAMANAGVPGIRYLDGGSRADGTGTSNHVIFDANTLSILRKYGIAGLIAGGGAAAAGKEQQ